MKVLALKIMLKKDLEVKRFHGHAEYDGGQGGESLAACWMTSAFGRAWSILALG